MNKINKKNLLKGISKKGNCLLARGSPAVPAYTLQTFSSSGKKEIHWLLHKIAFVINHVHFILGSLEFTLPGESLPCRWTGHLQTFAVKIIFKKMLLWKRKSCSNAQRIETKFTRVWVPGISSTWGHFLFWITHRINFINFAANWSKIISWKYILD